MSLDINLAPFAAQIREVIRTSILDNFETEGRFGNGVFGGGQSNWQESLRAKKQSGKTLSDTGQLERSIRVNVTGGGNMKLLDGDSKIDINLNGNGFEIELGSNKPYAAIHEFGGTISMPEREGSAKWKAKKNKDTGNYNYKFAKNKARGKNVIERKFRVGAFNITMPARPFLVIQDDDLIRIQQKFLIWLSKKMK